MSDTVTPFQAPIGTHDVLAPNSAEWEGVIATFAQFAYRYGFELVITPMFEDVGVFNRGIGEESEMATKEMYVFTDRGDRVYALRPEGTASVVRAFIQHSPTPPWKAWYFDHRLSLRTSPGRAATASTTSSASRCSAPMTRPLTSKSSRSPSASTRDRSDVVSAC